MTAPPLRVLGLVPARGGSKGVPGKNARPLAGLPPLARAIRCGQLSGVLDRIVVSTDDAALAELARAAGALVPALRPPELAADESPMIDAVLHMLEVLRGEGYEPEAVALLQPTSPLRTPEHVRAAVSLLGPEAESVCSVTEVPRELCPHYVMRLTESGYLDYFLPEGRRYKRRQDVPAAFRRDGTIFLTRTGVLREARDFYGERCVPMVVPGEQSLSIDTPDQWAEAEAVLRRVDPLLGAARYAP